MPLLCLQGHQASPLRPLERDCSAAWHKCGMLQRSAAQAAALLRELARCKPADTHATRGTRPSAGGTAWCACDATHGAGPKQARSQIICRRLLCTLGRRPLKRMPPPVSTLACTGDPARGAPITCEGGRVGPGGGFEVGWHSRTAGSVAKGAALPEAWWLLRVAAAICSARLRVPSAPARQRNAGNFSTPRLCRPSARALPALQALLPAARKLTSSRPGCVLRRYMARRYAAARVLGRERGGVRVGEQAGSWLRLPCQPTHPDGRHVWDGSVILTAQHQQNEPSLTSGVNGVPPAQVQVSKGDRRGRQGQQAGAHCAALHVHNHLAAGAGKGGRVPGTWAAIMNTAETCQANFYAASWQHALQAPRWRAQGH